MSRALEKAREWGQENGKVEIHRLVFENHSSAPILLPSSTGRFWFLVASGVGFQPTTSSFFKAAGWKPAPRLTDGSENRPTSIARGVR